MRERTSILKVNCPWCNQPLYETLGEGEDICDAECRTEGCKGEECRFTVQTGRKDHIIFIEDDGEDMIYSVHSGGWQRDKPEGAGAVL